MKICLATAHQKPQFIPLSLLYLKASLVERTGGLSPDDVTILEFGRDATAIEIAERVLAVDADVLGLSCYVWNIRALMAAARLIKDRRRSTTIILGGPEVGPMAASALELYPAVDVVVKSEGEIPFCELVDHCAAGTDPDRVPGICFRRNGTIVDTGEAPILRDLNALPSPHTPVYATAGRRVICVETQRGCVFRCNFCFYNKDLSIRNRRFDIDRVKREILFWLDRDIIELYLMDPVFNLNAERAKDICRFIAQHNHRKTPVHAEVWAEFIDEELAALMREAHFTSLEVGLQTTDDNVLATVERRLRLQKFIDGVNHLKANGLAFEVQLIYGLPGETRDTFRKSLNFAASLDPPNLSVFPLMVLPGTELWRKAAGLGLAYDAEPPYYVRSHFSMDESDIDYGWKVTRALDWLEIPRTIRLLSRERNVTFADIVDEWIEWHPQRAVTGEHEDDVRTIPDFVEHFCAKKAIPPEFYRGFAAIEFKQGGPEGPPLRS
jgi:radical SAM superfamily enzyme YgiQ (UPF0313 family)